MIIVFLELIVFDLIVAYLVPGDFLSYIVEYRGLIIPSSFWRDKIMSSTPHSNLASRARSWDKWSKTNQTTPSSVGLVIVGEEKRERKLYDLIDDFLSGWIGACRHILSNRKYIVWKVVTIKNKCRKTYHKDQCKHFPTLFLLPSWSFLISFIKKYSGFLGNSRTPLMGN